jgi:hypothetical protein
MLIEKVSQRTFLYDTKSPDYRDQHMRANAWEGLGKELKMKLKFYVSSRFWLPAASIAAAGNQKRM